MLVESYFWGTVPPHPAESGNQGYQWENFERLDSVAATVLTELCLPSTLQESCDTLAVLESTLPAEQSTFSTEHLAVTFRSISFAILRRHRT